MGAYEHTWAPIGAHERSQQVMSTELFHLTINKKCSVLKWPPCSILTISHSIFHRIMKNWTFLKSTQNGLLKNSQYEISKLLGSREIPKTKVDTALWDTLYIHTVYWPYDHISQTGSQFKKILLKDPGTHSAAWFYRCNITNIVVYNVRKLLLRIYCIPLHLSNQGCILHCIYVGNWCLYYMVIHTALLHGNVIYKY